MLSKEMTYLEKGDDYLRLFVTEYPDTPYVVNQLEERLEGVSIIQFIDNESSKKSVYFGSTDLLELKNVLTQLNYSLNQARVIINWVTVHCNDCNKEDISFILNRANENLVW